MISNSDLSSNLIQKKYTPPVQQLIHRFTRPYPTGIEYIRRLDQEYKIVEQKGFVNTFHRVCDLMDLIKAKNIPHVLRGSAASSLLCYQLGEIIVVDETKELLKKLGHKKLTVDLQEEVNAIPNSLVKYNLEIGKDKMSIDYTYNVQAKQTGITNLLQDLKDAGFKLKDLKTEQSTLEKIFVSLVKENNEI